MSWPTMTFVDRTCPKLKVHRRVAKRQGVDFVFTPSQWQQQQWKQQPHQENDVIVFSTYEQLNNQKLLTSFQKQTKSTLFNSKLA